MKNSCAAELTTYAMCLERSSTDMALTKCRKTQAAFDACMKQNLNQDRPHYAYHTMAKIHDTTRYVMIQYWDWFSKHVTKLGLIYESFVKCFVSHLF